MADPTLIQSVGREVHTSSGGMEIQRRFYFEPYESFPAILDALQGWVRRGSFTGPGAGVFVPSETDNWFRQPPARDPYITNCFCNEARVEFSHPFALTTSPTIAVAAANSLIKKLEMVQEQPKDGTAGGNITAIYRPLISARPEEPIHVDRPQFDWLDPHFSPSFKQIPWPDGLVSQGILTNPFGASIVAFTIPKALAEPISVPVADFSVKRILVGEPPWETFRGLAGRINDVEFPPASAFATGLPKFPRGTLKFETVEVLPQLDGAGNKWYEITLFFSWLNLYDQKVYDQSGNLAPGDVTWNHVFMRPTHLVGGRGEIGWYFVHREEARSLFGFAHPFPLQRLSAGGLYTYGKFDGLFELNP